MPSLEISLIIPAAGLLTPLAGLGRLSRPNFARHALPVAPADAVLVPQQRALVMRWRIDPEGALIMEWTA
jgi:hypothetical protein